MIQQQLRKARSRAQRGELVQARQLYLSILDQYPKNSAALQGLRSLQPRLTAADEPSPEQIKALDTLLRQGQHQALLQQAHILAMNFPKVAMLYNIIGTVYCEYQQLDEAIDAYNQAITIAPNYVDAYSGLGLCMKLQGKYEQALAYYASALQLNPNSADTHSKMGFVYEDMGRLDEAIQQQHRALQVDPDYAWSHTRLGTIYNGMGQYDKAIACHRRAIQISPDFADAYGNMAVANSALGHYDEALANYRQALSRSPDRADIHFNLALILLLTGDFANGWREYEWRAGGSKDRLQNRGSTQPVWLGDSDIAGKTILIYSEQGLGDTMLFSRYVKMVADLGAKVLFEVQEQVAPLFASFNSYAKIIVRGRTLMPEFDMHCPLLSLPLVFATELDSVPNEIGYLYVPRDKIKHWRARLGKRNKPRIGLVWRGNPTHIEVHRRSLPLTIVLQYLPPDYDYISLQHQMPDEDRPLLSQLNHVGEDFKDFADTAAVCMQLDVLISIDTSVAHLGGILGLPTWVLLPYSPDFRWLLERTDSPWYPSARLFRQTKLDDWPGVLTAVGKALDERFGDELRKRL